MLNSDEFFFQKDTIKIIAKAFESSNADLVYAKGLYVDKENPTRIECIYPSRIFRKRFLSFGWIPLHTTIFVRRKVFEKYGMYYLGYTIASDYEISLR